jgi:TPP-dependent pyruvate/acetoin dehydrogenase alpha subunit
MHGHGAHDSQRYVPKEELDEWAGRDPLALWREWAANELGWGAHDQTAMEERVAREVQAGLADALDAPYPDAAELLPSVFA